MVAKWFFPIGFFSVLLILGNPILAQPFPEGAYDSLLYIEPDSAYRLGKTYYEQTEKKDAQRGLLLNLMGNAAWVKGDLILAFTHYLDAISFYREIGDSLNLKIPEANLGNVLNDLGAYDLAKNYYLKNKDEAGAGNVFNNVGTALQRQGKIDSAELMFLKADSFYHLKDKDMRYLSQSNLALIYALKKQPEKALPFLEESIAKINENGDAKMLIFNHLTLSKLLWQKNDFEAALRRARQAARTAGQKPFLELQRDSYLLLYKFNSEAGNPDSALYFLEKSDSLTAIMGQSRGRDITTLISRLYAERALQEKTLNSLQTLRLKEAIRQEQLSKNRLIVLISAILILSLIAWRFQQLLLKRKQLTLELEKERAHRIQSELTQEKVESQKQQEQLHFKEKELLTYSLKEVEWENSLRELKKSLEKDFLKQPNARLLNVFIRDKTRNQNQWDTFKTRFESIHESFFKNLIKAHPNLSSNDLKLCAFTLLSLSSKEIAVLQGIKSTSVDIARHRLRGKLLLKEESLAEYLRKFI